VAKLRWSVEPNVGLDKSALGKLWGALHIWRNVEFFDMWSTTGRSGVLGGLLRV